MTTCFERWEKDPFFSAAEEVQQSADRMESAYRQWIHEVRNPAGTSSGDDDRRELHTAFGTAKWQLDELERAVRSSDKELTAGEETRTRHAQFVAAMGDKISAVENSLREAGESKVQWVRLDESERDELARFLSGSSVPRPVVSGSVDCLEKYHHPNHLPMPKEETERGHRKTASAGPPDIESWKISVSMEGDKHPNQPLPKTSSFSSISKLAKSTAQIKWPKNGFRKSKCPDQNQGNDLIPLRNHQLSQGINACHERSRRCLASCPEESCEKELYGWLGALHRQLQRSRYHIQYGRPTQMILLTILAVLFIVLVVLHVILKPGVLRTIFGCSN